jgi:hypothetical protein
MALVAAVLALGAQTVRIEGLHLGVKVGPISLHVVNLTGLRQRAATADPHWRRWKRPKPRLAKPRLTQITNLRPDQPKLRGLPMPVLPIIMQSLNVLRLCMLFLFYSLMIILERPALVLFLAILVMMTAACTPAPLKVQAAEPLCPEPIRLPKAMTARPDLPSWFPLPAPIGKAQHRSRSPRPTVSSRAGVDSPGHRRQAPPTTGKGPLMSCITAGDSIGAGIHHYAPACTSMAHKGWSSARWHRHYSKITLSADRVLISPAMMAGATPPARSQRSESR